MWRNDGKSTLSLKHTIPVLSHEKHAHWPKPRWNPGKNAGWQGRQLVVGQINFPVSRRNRESDNKLSCILRQQTKNKYEQIYTHTHLYVCLYVCLYDERERISATLVTTAALKSVRVNLCFHRKKRKEISTHAHACACLCPPQLNRISTASQGCATMHYMYEWVCYYYFTNASLCLFVCLYMYVHVSWCLWTMLSASTSIWVKQLPNMS
jgi:hypothetical protein